MIKVSNYFAQFVITRALVPGQIENWVTIVDLKGVGLTKMPKKLLKALVSPMQQNFKGRLYRMYILNAAWAVKTLWKVVKKVVDPLTVQKFVVLGDKYDKELQELIDLEKLEKKYGGTLPDKTDNFFPPDLL